MILHDPFKISARLLPALLINQSWLSWDGSNFFIDTPIFEHVIDDLHPGPYADTQECFRAILSFMLAAGESRKYRERTGEPGENEDLFPAHIVDWITDNYDELECLSSDIEEKELIHG